MLNSSQLLHTPQLAAQRMRLHEVQEFLNLPFPVYCERYLKIRTKTEGIKPLILNAGQHKLWEHTQAQLQLRGYVRTLLLKSRQWGGSSIIGAMAYRDVTSGPAGTKAFIMTHRRDTTSALFEMAKRFHDYMPTDYRTFSPGGSATEMKFPKRDAMYSVGTAGSKTVGHGETIQFLHACLSPDTLIVDGETLGLRRMDSFVVGDMVRTHTGQKATVKVISKQRKRVRPITIRTVTSTPLMATDEHRLFTSRGWVEVGDLVEGDEVGYPIRPIADGEEVLPFRLKDSVRPQGGGTRETGPDAVQLDYRIGRMLGLYLAEGTVSGNRVHFSVHRNEVERTLAWLDSLSELFVSRSIYHHKNSKTSVVTVHGRSFTALINGLCGKTDSKQLPACAFSSGREFGKGLLHGYLSGDGHFTPKGSRRICATSIRSAITIGMRDLMASLGYGWASINLKPAALRAGRNEKDAWMLSLCGKGVELLSAECGKPFVKRQRANGSGNYGARTDDQYAWLKVESIGDAVMSDVMDFEIDDQDHSYCTLQCATHNSEFALWPNAGDHLKGIFQTVPTRGPGTKIFIESTAKGMGNEFHRMVIDARKGDSEYWFLFVPWFIFPEYSAPVDFNLNLTPAEELFQQVHGLTLEQMAFRAVKIRELGGGGIGEAAFCSQYPTIPEDAFRTATEGSYFDATYVVRARKANVGDGYGVRIMGIDPSHVGGDRFSVCLRVGRRAKHVGEWRKARTTESLGKVVMLIKQHQPEYVFVDQGGPGAGIVDPLMDHQRALGCTVIPVDFGGSADDPERYNNKREEMYGRTKQWLEGQMPVQIDDRDDLQTDLTNPQFRYDNAGRIQPESKQTMCKAPRNLPSPDLLESLVLTHAYEVQGSDDAVRRAANQDIDPHRPLNWKAV